MDSIYKYFPMKIRSFYLSDEDRENLDEWMTSLLRDRYHVVCEERNAYQQMQFEMTGAIDTQSSLRQTTEIEKKYLESELTRYRREAEDAYTYLQGGLVELGVSLFIL
jgi:hypothetical protein